MSLTPSHGLRASIFTALAFLALALFSPPVVAQVPFRCAVDDTPEEVCDGTLCVYKYRRCDFDFDEDPATGFEQSAFFFENRGADTDPPFGDGDRKCYQGESFDENDPLPDVADYRLLHFAVLEPVDYVSGSFPLLVMLRGGGPGWVDSGSQLNNSWALEFDDPANPVWRQGEYHANMLMAQGDFNEQVILDFLLDTDGLVASLREKGWGVLVPSGCSHDDWNGRSTLAQGNEAFEEAAQTRFSYDSVVEALRIVEAKYGIHHFYIAGSSGGGLGTFLMAKDLPLDLPNLADRFHGAITDAAPFETDEMAELFLSSDGTDLRTVDTDFSCAGAQATVPCDSAAEPFATAFVKTGLTAKSASDDILHPFTPIEVPLLHLWNKRDKAHCYDYCYSEDHLHGPIRGAIEFRKGDATEERFDFSENMEFCAGACLGVDSNGEDVEVKCSVHGALGGRDSKPVDPVLQCALDWIDAIDATDPVGGQPAIEYSTPASCLAEVEVLPSGPSGLPVCQDQKSLGW